VIRIDFDLGDGVRIRSLDPGDAEALFDLVDANRERLRPWMPWEAATRSSADILAFIERSRLSSTDAEGNGIWVDGALAGTMGMTIDTLANSAEIGYWIDGAHEGRGIVTRACRRFIDEAFGAFGLHRVSLHAATTNRRSQAVAERLGMTREAVLREAERTVDGYHDLVVFSVLEHEWPTTS
jgi:ribosomal-protein-serine acetyltransferase